MIQGSVYVEQQRSSRVKRSVEQDENYAGKRLVKRVIHFVSQAYPQSSTDFNLNPPDLLKACADVAYSQNLPQKFQDFVRIFGVAKHAYEVDFVRTGKCDFELTHWECSSIVENLNFSIHLNFLNQIFNPVNVPKLALSSPIWELYAEYIIYTFNRVDTVDLVGESFLNLFLSVVSLLVPDLYRAVFEYSPEEEKVSGTEMIKIWHTIIHIVLKNRINVITHENVTLRWFEVFYWVSKRFGVFAPLFLSCDDDEFSIINNLNSILVQQPLCAAMSRHDSDALIEHFRTDSVIRLIENSGIKRTFFWIDRMLQFDQDFKYPKVEDESKLSHFADTLFDCIYEFNRNFSSFLTLCLDSNFIYLAQFILMYSSKARAAIPSKKDQCALLMDSLRVRCFDFDYYKFVTIIVGFNLTSDDIEEFLLSELEPIYLNGPVVQSLRFILQVVQSAPIEFTPETIWTPPADPSTLKFDTRNPFLYDAAKIILARHFRIAPFFTEINVFSGEEACYRDLAWFMTFFINLYRPDLGPEFRIRVI